MSSIQYTHIYNTQNITISDLFVILYRNVNLLKWTKYVFNDTQESHSHTYNTTDVNNLVVMYNYILFVF